MAGTSSVCPKFRRQRGTTWSALTEAPGSSVSSGQPRPCRVALRCLSQSRRNSQAKPFRYPGSRLRE
jgi:hypothetical protein